MPKQMPPDDFRAVRVVLEPDDYAVSSEEPESPPSDLIPVETWRHLTILPDEVAIRTSNRHGALIDTLNELGNTWAYCIGDSEQTDLVGLSMIEVINEHDACLYNMLVGFYRQAIDSLRIVFESVSIGAYCQLTARTDVLQSWLDGTESVRFDTAISGLQAARQTLLLHEYLERTVHIGFADQADRSRGSRWVVASVISKAQQIFARTPALQQHEPLAK